MNKRHAAKAATREKLLLAAQVLFRRQGYEEVTLRQVAAEAETSTGAIFNHFPEGKAELFEAAMGEAPPDLRAFLDLVAVKCAGYPGDVGALAKEAARLRRILLGGHS